MGTRTSMLIGEYTHTVDDKNRISLPVKFRKELGKKVVITHGLDNCLFVYPLKAWERVLVKLSELSIGQADTRGFNRFMLAGAVETDIDSIGRILLPEYLRDFASIKSKAAVLGIHDRVEIWNDKSWNDYKKRVENQADVLAQKLGEIGVI